MFTSRCLGVCYPEAFSNPRIMCLISSVSKEPFSFCHCRHPLRKPKHSLTFLPSSPIVFAQTLIAQKAAVRLAFKSMPAVLLAELMNEYEALSTNELLSASSTNEAFGWVGYRADARHSQPRCCLYWVTVKTKKSSWMGWIHRLSLSLHEPSRFRLLLTSPAPRTTRLPVWPPGPRPPGSCPKSGEAQTQGGPILPAHRRRVLLSICTLQFSFLIFDFFGDTDIRTNWTVEVVFFFSKTLDCKKKKTLHTLPQKVITKRGRAGLSKMCARVASLLIFTSKPASSFVLSTQQEARGEQGAGQAFILRL